MRGLWHTGSTGISPGYGFAPEGGWARYDNVDVACADPCTIVLRMAASTSARAKSGKAGVGVQIAIGEPEEHAVIARARITDIKMDLVELQTTAAVHGTGMVLFLLLDSECEVDWFRFHSTGDH
jgi:hypothetical protein